MRNRVIEALGEGSATGGDGAKVGEVKKIKILPPNIGTVCLTIVGTAPLATHAWSRISIGKMKDTQEQGSQAAGKKSAKPPKDFPSQFEAAKHVSTEGWIGFPAGGMRSCLIRACKLCGIEMTTGKVSLFVMADGFNKDTGTPLIRIHSKNDPDMWIAPVRNDNGGADLRVRPKWDQWEIQLRIKYNANYFSPEEIANLVETAGQWVGIGEGRNFSPDSNGFGFGSFTLKDGAVGQEV